MGVILSPPPGFNITPTQPATAPDSASDSTVQPLALAGEHTVEIQHPPKVYQPPPEVQKLPLEIYQPSREVHQPPLEVHQPHLVVHQPHREVPQPLPEIVEPLDDVVDPPAEFIGEVISGPSGSVVSTGVISYVRTGNRADIKDMSDLNESLEVEILHVQSPRSASMKHKRAKRTPGMSKMSTKKERSIFIIGDNENEMENREKCIADKHVANVASVKSASVINVKNFAETNNDLMSNEIVNLNNESPIAVCDSSRVTVKMCDTDNTAVTVGRHDPGNAVRSPELYTESSQAAGDRFQDSFILDTQTARLMCNLTSVGHTSEMPYSKAKGTPTVVLNDPANNVAIFRPTDTTPEMYSEDTHVESATSKYMTDYMTQSAMVAISASPVLPSGNSDQNHTHLPVITTKSPLTIPDGFGSGGSTDSDGSYDLLPESHRLAMQSVCEDASLNSSEDADLLGDSFEAVPFQSLQYSVRRSKKLAGNIDTAGVDTSTKGKCHEVTATYKDLSEDLELAMQMSESFVTQQTQINTKVNTTDKTNTLSVVQATAGAAEQEISTCGDGNSIADMNLALSVSQMQDILNEGTTDSDNDDRNTAVVSSGAVHASLSDCFSPETDAMLNAFCGEISHNPSTTGSSVRKKPATIKSNDRYTDLKNNSCRKRRNQTDTASAGISPPKMMKGERLFTDHQATESLNDSANSSMASDYVPPTPPDDSLCEKSKTATPRKLVGGLLATPKRSTEKPGRSPRQRHSVSSSNEKTSDSGMASQSKFSLSGNSSSEDQAFTIIDVAADKQLFLHFVEEWMHQKSYSLCLACERLLPPAPTGGGIGANFHSGK